MGAEKIKLEEDEPKSSSNRGLNMEHLLTARGRLAAVVKVKTGVIGVGENYCSIILNYRSVTWIAHESEWPSSAAFGRLLPQYQSI
jgi:hypothetical protein